MKKEKEIIPNKQKKYLKQREKMIRNTKEIIKKETIINKEKKL